MTEKDRSALISAWEHGTDENNLTPEVKEAAEAIQDYLGAKNDSPAYYLAHGFILGLIEGRRLEERKGNA